MATNVYFSPKVRSEQRLYEDIVIESLKMYGQDVYYLPRDIVVENRIFGSEVQSRFNSAYKVEMYIENTGGFDGEGDLFTKFGVEIRDEATFVVARRRWTDTVGRADNDIDSIRPREGDLIYLPLSNSMFEISRVEHEDPFYQLNNLPTYKLRCNLFEYAGDDIDTGVTEIDDIEKDFATKYRITFIQTRGTATVPVSDYQLGTLEITNGGRGYPFVPSVQLLNQPVISSIYKFGESSLNPSSSDLYTLTEKTGSYSRESYVGELSMWVYMNELPAEGEYYALVLNGLQLSGGGRSYRYQWGINSDGRLVVMNYNDSSTLTVGSNIPQAPQMQAQTWHHVQFGYRGEPTGFETRTRQYYIDGQIVWRDNSTNGGGLIYDDYVLGGSRTLDGVQFKALDGYIDDFYATDVNPDYRDTITVPTAAKDADEASVAYENFDVDAASISVTTSLGEVDSITITGGNHQYWRTTPNILIDAPTPPRFNVNDNIQQALLHDGDDATIQGTVLNWQPSTLTLEVGSVGATDGHYHEFDLSTEIEDLSTGDRIVPASVTEVTQTQADDQSSDFESFGDNIIDFTESNPFGDPS